MSMFKKLVITSVFTAMASIVLYCLGLYQEIDTLEFEDLLFFLYSAQALMVLTFVFVICGLLCLMKNIKASSLKKTVVAVTVVVSAVSIYFIGYNSINYYDGYTPQNIMDNDKAFVQSFFPYHKIEDGKSAYISVSHITGTEYLVFDSQGLTENGSYLAYKAEYFESSSPFMSFKFYLERGLLLPSDVVYINSFNDCEEKEINGYKVSVFTKNNSEDMGVYMQKGNKAIYVELKNGSKSPIKVEDFIKITAEQFETIEQTVYEKQFLDIPFSDKFNRRILNKQS